MAWTQFDSDYQSHQHTAAVARTSGVPVFIQNTVLVPIADFEASETATLVYQCERVLADKKTGAAVAADALVRIDISGANVGEVSVAAKAATNTACGFALEAAVSAATKVAIRFDGTPRGV